MPGIYDRMAPAGLDGNGGDRLNVHLTSEALCAYLGTTFTKQQVIDALNEDLSNRNSAPLRAADLTDLDNIKTEIDSKATNTQKIIYVLSAMTPVFVAAELDLINETAYRSALGIPVP